MLMTKVGANLAQWIKPIHHSQLTTEYDFWTSKVLSLADFRWTNIPKSSGAIA